MGRAQPLAAQIRGADLSIHSIGSEPEFQAPLSQGTRLPLLRFGQRKESAMSLKRNAKYVDFSSIALLVLAIAVPAVVMLAA